MIDSIADRVESLFAVISSMSSRRFPTALTMLLVGIALPPSAYAEPDALAAFSPPSHEFSVILPVNVTAVPSDDLHSGITYSASAGSQTYSVSSTKLFNDNGDFDQFAEAALKRWAATPTSASDAAGKGWTGKAFSVHTNGGDATLVIAAAERGDKDGKVVYEFMAPASLTAPAGKSFVDSIVVFPEEAIHAHLRDLRPGTARWQQVNFWAELAISASLCLVGLWFGFFRLSRKSGRAMSASGA